ncbi:MAG: DUF4271 domain-containing protein [Prevotella sp.]|nr:DUF4271 domain-containing protein [Prevotella sp.]
MTPIQVLRLLPKDTTTVELPQYYREGQFVGDTLFYQEIEGGNYGVPGTTLQKTALHSDLIILLLIGCILIYNFTISHSWGILTKQTKALFYSRKTEPSTGTGYEQQFLLLLLTTSCIVCSIYLYLYVMTFVSETFILSSEYLLLPIIFAMFAGYHALRFLCYYIVNITFFSSQQNGKFMTSSLFLSGMAGVLLLPGVFLMAYFDLSAVAMIIYAGIVLFLVKILSFYKSYDIFFKGNVYFLQNILYFCALEITPLVMLFSGLSAIVGILKVN